MARHRRFLCVGSVVLVLWGSLGSATAEAGGLFRRRNRVALEQAAPIPTASRVVSGVPPKPLGTFAPTPMIVIRGDFPTGGGYSPLNTYGNTSMDVYGPMSAFRSTTAPVVEYSRGYDGSSYVGLGNSFSTPNQPGLSPMVYPTQASNYFGFRELHDPPSWPRASNWIDQN